MKRPGIKRGPYGDADNLAAPDSGLPVDPRPTIRETSLAGRLIKSISCSDGNSANTPAAAKFRPAGEASNHERRTDRRTTPASQTNANAGPVVHRPTRLSRHDGADGGASRSVVYGDDDRRADSAAPRLPNR